MTDIDLSTRIDGLFFGKVTQQWDSKEHSAIGKIPVTGHHEINENGFVTDEQADRENLGGHDKAIHHYATGHFADWVTEGEIPVGTEPTAFGENIASLGMTEKPLASVRRYAQARRSCRLARDGNPDGRSASILRTRRWPICFKRPGGQVGIIVF